MKVLFIHDNFPAQFGALGMWLARTGWQVTFATAAAQAEAPGISILRYKPHREPSKETHPYAQPMDKAAINAQGFVRAAIPAREAGYAPDVIVSHAGWGAGMFARDVFPKAAYVAYCEWWYNYPGVDVTYLAGLMGTPFKPSVEGPMHERARNAPIAMDIGAADAVICPTQFQAAQFPAPIRSLLTVQHDGIDTEFLAPDALDRTSTLDGLVAEDAHVITYATRGMEPHRGFPQFMAALQKILAADPKAVAVIAGENRVAYGGKTLRETDWKQKAMERNNFDHSRVHFVGHLSKLKYRQLLRRSDAHVYLTIPFVLSWSMLESMSLGCALVLSDTDPVREFADETTARLVDIADPDQIAARVLETFADPEGTARRREAARRVIEEHYSIQRLWPEKAAMFAALAMAGR